MSQRQLNEWLSWLETQHPRAIDLGLERVQKIAKRLHLLPYPIFTITVGGTNGKGSCVAMLEAILSAAGYRVGSYTSPHILRYNERIRIAGEEISDQALCQAFAVIDRARGQYPLSYFEFGTLAALYLFQQAELDIVLLEVGLGGRLDAVNIVDANIAIIASIALDHMEWLGNTREAIALEKAGIFRSGRPAICGDEDPPANLLAYVKQHQIPLFCQHRDFTYQAFAKHWQWSNKQQQLNDLPIPPLQLQNASTVLQAISLLPTPFQIPLSAIKQGLATVKLAGRIQLFTGEINHIFDVAHNPAATALLAKQLQIMPMIGRNIAVFGMLADKDIAQSIAPLLPLISRWYIADLNVARGSKAEPIATLLKQAGATQIQCYESTVAAYQAAYAAASKGDRIIVFGSFHTVAEIMVSWQKI